jgi:hypothetical protein
MQENRQFQIGVFLHFRTGVNIYKKDPIRYAMEEAGGREQFKRDHWQQ